MGFLEMSKNEEELRSLISGIGKPDSGAMEESRRRWLDIAKPLYSLGKFEEIITKIAGIYGKPVFSLEKKAVIVMCADNGIVEEGITQTGSRMTAVVSRNFMDQRTSVSVMAKKAGAEVFPVDIGINEDIPGITDGKYKVRAGTANMTLGAAMERDEGVRAVLNGIEKVRELKEKGYMIIATGEMGIGNTAASSAVSAALLKRPVREMTGRGAGLDDERLEKKILAIEKAVKINEPSPEDPLDTLHKVGGLDIAGLTGVFLGGGIYRIPVLIDGFISAAAALIAFRLCAGTRDYMIASHLSKEPAAGLIFKELSLEPVIDAGMFLGEGTGAVMLFPLLDMALSVYNDMITFDGGDYGEKYKDFSDIDLR